MKNWAVLYVYMMMFSFTRRSHPGHRLLMAYILDVWCTLLSHDCSTCMPWIAYGQNYWLHQFTEGGIEQKRTEPPHGLLNVQKTRPCSYSARTFHANFSGSTILLDNTFYIKVFLPDMCDIYLRSDNLVMRVCKCTP